LWSTNGELHYRAPKGALTREEIHQIAALKGPIIALLEKAGVSDLPKSDLERRVQQHRAPLTFQQMAHWNKFQLRDHPSLRQVASAMHFGGRLNLGALERSIAEVIRRQGALRTRVVLCDGIPMQEIVEPLPYALDLRDLSALPASVREPEANRLIEDVIGQPVDVCADPLFAVLLLRLQPEQYVLIIALEHLISDAYSLNVFWRELFPAYLQAARGEDFRLSPVPVSLDEYALWQQTTQGSWLEKNRAFWNSRLLEWPLVRFPTDQGCATADPRESGLVLMHIRKDIKAQLREWCRQKKTTLMMSVLTAYIGLLLRWCNTPEIVVQFVIDSRINPSLEHTIGYFASRIYVHVKSESTDSFLDLMNRVTAGYCQAHERADFYYMGSQASRPKFSRNTVFNWIPPRSKVDFAELRGPDNALACSPFPYENPVWKWLGSDNDPTITFFETDDDEVMGHLNFTLKRHSVASMERFERNFLLFIKTLLRESEGRVSDIVLQ
jgi:NRPS condensation-like uncharacterized protein